MKQQQEPLPVLDGFSFSTNLRCNLTFKALAIQQFEALRRATAMRNKVWCVPQDSKITIPAFDSYERQVRVATGSVIWGYSFCGPTGEQVLDANGSQAWEVRDACDDIPLWSEAVTRRRALQNPAGGGNQVPQQILSRLLVVGPPGLLNVVIANIYPRAQTGQLILYGGEPSSAY